ncbi:type I-F CRISPR-associated protein Csy2 [Chromobacterium violaceum]|uniref:Type I-F CRISPR-associated protein Csy2 n=1 Tax=Chromobacterium violaceum TaxID=536 RepID=A0A202B8H2_CHRVL|nr:type I-F CRISPR-associated protein Csy2 [Chromobacterium violaceum]OVE47867.1 type I-F CRISPR-associated protein Csy2 [Chromobacterium violaceum]
MPINPRSLAQGLLILPRLRVQNANALSSPHTWGFPALSAFTGLMTALERKLGADSELTFHGVGVICHSYQAQTNGDYIQRFNLSRNPVDKDGGTAAIVEEGRIHLDLTLVFGVSGNALAQNDDALAERAAAISRALETMRVAGGTLIPPPAGHYAPKPQLITLPEGEDERAARFRALRRRWLPGFALVARDDLLSGHHARLRETAPGATLLDAWLDKSRLNHWPEAGDGGQVIWRHSRQQGEGWIVPIPVGYGALSELYPAGSVANARDAAAPFRFVESLYSLGEWISPHRLQDAADLLWYPAYDAELGVYRCRNDYQTPSPSTQNDLGVEA